MALYDAQNVNPVFDPQGNALQTTVKLGGAHASFREQFALLGAPAGSYTLRISVQISDQTIILPPRSITIQPGTTTAIPEDIPVEPPAATN